MLLKIPQKDFFDVIRFHPHIAKEFFNEFDRIHRKQKYRNLNKLDVVLKKSEDLKGNVLVCCFKENGSVLVIDRKSRAYKLKFVKALIERSTYFDKR